MFSMTAAIAAETYDLVILNGRVMDPETKLDAVRNVGVKNGKITVITKDKIKGKETIDAKNYVVSPGFINMHDHNTAASFGQKLALRDGVTTPMEFEAGIYPVDNWYAYLESQTNYGPNMGRDYKDIIEVSTMKDGGLPFTGIPFVVVNGTVVVKDSKVLKGVYPGKAIRRAFK